MEIVIKISEERFRDIQRIAEVQFESNYFKTAEQIIANGTPLPKGRGRLNGKTYADKCGLEDGKRKALEQEPILDKIRAEIAEYDSIWVEYKITGRRDKDIEQLVSDVLSQAKKQVLEVIDKYKGESEVK